MRDISFYISEDSPGHKAIGLVQHINLSKETYDTIYDDLQTFFIENEKMSQAGFLNKIFFNYYGEALATISERLINKYDELVEVFNAKEFINNDKDLIEKFINKMLLVYEDELKEKALSYNKGIGFKFRINKENLEVLRTSTEGTYYDSRIGDYLKAIFEEYASLPTYRREQIIYKDYIEMINNAIKRKVKLRITNAPRLNSRTKQITQRQFYFSPYKIVQDKSNNFNYLIGYSEEIKDVDSNYEPLVSSFRISNIYNMTPRTTMSAFLSKAKKDLIEDELKAKEAQYLIGDLKTIRIKFTDKGIELFHRLIYLRPSNYKVLENNVYEFYCTELHAIFYFYKFGRDIEVLSPTSLRNIFIDRYKEALEQYNNN